MTCDRGQMTSGLLFPLMAITASLFALSYISWTEVGSHLGISHTAVLGFLSGVTTISFLYVSHRILRTSRWAA